MSTFAVFGMTLALAMTDARKATGITRPNPKTGHPPIALTEEEWLEKVKYNAMRIMTGVKVKQLSPMFDAPQLAEKFIEIARKSGDCRDLRIRAKRTFVDAQGEPVINPKTKAPKVGWVEWPASSASVAA
ncbi:hypothetical protein [Pseudomonas petrae]|uniref:Uncharacterized protein n=1 Tax=Pseudomonas petrae TaxID=2912190 RepID=A0ABS9ID09_9PSED|nr:hypothetical protein [Pseudomonas petrae]MCF7545312.1 hypothetical protein [Pseudomonas petrae]